MSKFPTVVYHATIFEFLWTYGPMADGNTGYICNLYYEGKIGSVELLNGFVDPATGVKIVGIRPYKDNYDQLVFHHDWVNEGVLSNPRFELVEETARTFS